MRAGRLLAPFSFHRMTWIKPSFRWLMHRSNWARIPGQERVFAVRMTRQGCETGTDPCRTHDRGPAAVAKAAVHVLWNPERAE
ncbi:DUF4291 family protein [Streptomyces caniscabiei]|uniref:DUF4291 family protein n=1 Tax=Streptomyces caniscabiei TaxID=2746961 RepID=UPI0029BFBCD1|nr:DUF4291 family protein [Streptomyces caniscabiei]